MAITSVYGNAHDALQVKSIQIERNFDNFVIIKYLIKY